MKNIYIIILLVITGLALSQCKKSGTIQQATCQAYNSIDTNGVVDIYVYDSQGRLTTDSVPGNGATYYNYSGNIVASTSGAYAGIIATYNSAGWPITNVVPSPFTSPTTYTGIYNADGTLDSITTSNSGATYQYIDSVVYVNGNIVSFRIPASNTHVTCAYNNIPYKPYYPQAKMFALYSGFGSSNLQPSYGNFNPQPFSKNLLTSYSYPLDTNGVYAYTVTSNFNYQTDSKGNITYIYEVTNSFGPPNSYAVRFSYNCQ